MLEVLRNIEPISQRTKGLRNDAAVAPSVPRYDLDQITVPTLLISAQDDLFGTFKAGSYKANHIPGARFLGYPTGGHLLVGHGSDARRELTEFLKPHSTTYASSKWEIRK